MGARTTRGRLAENVAAGELSAAQKEKARIDQLSKAAIADFYSIGRPASPARVLIYGKPKVGKTWFLAKCPKLFLLPIEEGANQYPVAQWKRPEDKRGSRIRSLDEFFYAVSVLRHGKHDFEAVGVDTADALQELLKWDLEARLRTIAKGDDDPRSFGALNEDYSEGYRQLADGWGRVLRAIDELRTERGMHVFFTAHERTETVRPVGKDEYKRYAPSIMGTDAANVFKAYFEYILFFQTELAIVRDGKNGPTRAVAGARKIHCVQKATHEAGCRGDALWPDTIELDAYKGFAKFWAARRLIEAHGAKIVEVLGARFEAACARLPKERADKARTEFWAPARAARDYAELEVVAETAEEMAMEVANAPVAGVGAVAGAKAPEDQPNGKKGTTGAAAIAPDALPAELT